MTDDPLEQFSNICADTNNAKDQSQYAKNEGDQADLRRHAIRRFRCIPHPDPLSEERGAFQLEIVDRTVFELEIGSELGIDQDNASAFLSTSVNNDVLKLVTRRKLVTEN